MTEWPPAVISPDGVYRYFLSRSWDPSGRTVAFIGLNPSTADASSDDPTIRRCIGFAKAWGGGTLVMVNLFGFRSTRPAVLRSSGDPVGSGNDHWMELAVSSSDIVVAAWGNHGALNGRSKLVRSRYAGRLWALDLTLGGEPKHPLYVPYSQTPFRIEA
jgi:hypothetical protein